MCPLAAAASRSGPTAYKQSAIKDEVGVCSGLISLLVAAAGSPLIPAAARLDAGAAARWSLLSGKQSRGWSQRGKLVLNGSFGATCPSSWATWSPPVARVLACRGARECWPCACLACLPGSLQCAPGYQFTREHQGFCSTTGTGPGDGTVLFCGGRTFVVCRGALGPQPQTKRLKMKSMTLEWLHITPWTRRYVYASVCVYMHMYSIRTLPLFLAWLFNVQPM